MEAFMKNNLCSAIGLNKDIVDNVVNNVVDNVGAVVIIHAAASFYQGESLKSNFC